MQLVLDRIHSLLLRSLSCHMHDTSEEISIQRQPFRDG